MADLFLNSEATLESRITIKLNFSADLDELYQQPKIGYRSKIFKIDSNTIYDFTYVDRSPHHKTEMITITGKVIAVSYTPNRSEFVHPIIYNSVAKEIGESEDTSFKPTSIKIDASTEYNRDIRIIDIADIRNIDLHDMGIDLSTYENGDIVYIKLLNGRIYNTAIIKDILTVYPDGEMLIVDELIPDEEKSDLTGEVIETAEFRKCIIKKDDIVLIDLKKPANIFDYSNGDTIEIYVSEDSASNGYTAYPGIIMDIITHKMEDDESGKYTSETIVGIVLKYREPMEDNTTKEVTRFFYMEEIVRILPFVFPDPDVTDMFDEGYSTGDDPDDIEADMYATSYEPITEDEEDHEEGTTPQNGASGSTTPIIDNGDEDP